MADIIVNSVTFDVTTQERTVNKISGDTFSTRQPRTTTMKNFDFDVYSLVEIRDDGTPPSNGTISGRIIKDSIPVPYVIVRLYYRVTGQLINQTTTDINGEFEFIGYNATTNNYFVIAAIDHPQIFSIKGFDKVTPAATP